MTLIGAAALKIIDRDGLEALTMRVLAAELGVSVNTIYWHARTKVDVLYAVGELVVAQVEVPADGEWHVRLAGVMRSIRNLIDAHPGVGSIGIDCPTSGPASLRLTDNIIGLLREGGFTEARALAAMRVLTGYVYGYTAMGNAYVGADAERYRTHIRGAARDELPYVAAIGPHLSTDNSPENFEFGLELIVGGLRQFAR